MIRETALLVTMLFVVPIYLLAAGPVVDDIQGFAQDSQSVQDNADMNQTLTDLEPVMMIYVPLLWAGGWILWYFLFALRQDRFVGTAGGGLR